MKRRSKKVQKRKRWRRLTELRTEKRRWRGGEGVKEERETEREGSARNSKTKKRIATLAESRVM